MAEMVDDSISKKRASNDAKLEDVPQQKRQKVDASTEPLAPIRDNLPEYVLPRDEKDSRYIKAFSYDDEKGITEFFDKYGVVVIENILTPEECKATVNDCLSVVEELSDFEWKRDEPSTWKYWPYTGESKHGLATKKSVFTGSFMQNRQNPKVHTAFSTLLGTKDLLCNFDRYSWYRPTRGIEMKDGTEVNFPEFETMYSLHLDLNPGMFLDPTQKIHFERKLERLKYVDDEYSNNFIYENHLIHKDLYDTNGRHLQAGFNLLDNLEEDGGFQLVPGFFRHFQQWTIEAGDPSSPDHVCYDTQSGYVWFKHDHPFAAKSCRITMKAGSIVIWDQRTPHGTRPNRSSRPRCAQYLKMFPATQIGLARARRRGEQLLYKLREMEFEDKVTPLGRKTFGLNLLPDEFAGQAENMGKEK